MNPLRPSFKQMAALCVLAIGLAACGEPAAAPSNVAPISLALTEGQALWFRAADQTSVPLTADVTPNWEDEISTLADQSATLRLGDSTILRMQPDTRFKLRRPYSSANNRPVLRLLRGSLDFSVQGANFAVESYREVPLSLRIVLVNVVLEPQGGSSEFQIAFEGDSAEVKVRSGQVNISATDVRGTMSADWRAVLVPGETLQIIPPYTPTPQFSPTPMPTGTGSPSATWTATSTRVTLSTRPPVTATQPPPPPPTEDGGQSPKPTREPPTNTPIPATNTPEPTQAPQPTDTVTPRPTPGG